MNPFPWLNVKFEHTDAKPSPVGLAAWLGWAWRLGLLFGVMKILSMFV